MLKNPKTWIAAIGLLLLYNTIGRPSVVHLSPGILAPKQPRQVEIDNPKRWKKDDSLITALAEYSLSGIVVRSKRYYWGKEAGLAPIDFLMAWGAASDVSVLDKIKFGQSMRYYSWRTSDEDVDLEAISRNTANVHIIPANKNIEKKLKAVKWQQVVDLEGYLVQVDKPNGWSWTSSLTRDDTGAGACELFWVENIIIR